ncbi:hypothetical protein FKM82_018881 [Ascaphus truei]
MSSKQSWGRSTPAVLCSCSCPCTSPPSGSGRRVEGLSTWHRRRVTLSGMRSEHCNLRCLAADRCFGCV